MLFAARRQDWVYIGRCHGQIETGILFIINWVHCFFVLKLYCNLQRKQRMLRSFPIRRHFQRRLWYFRTIYVSLNRFARITYLRKLVEYEILLVYLERRCVQWKCADATLIYTVYTMSIKLLSLCIKCVYVPNVYEYIILYFLKVGISNWKHFMTFQPHICVVKDPHKLFSERKAFFSFTMKIYVWKDTSYKKGVFVTCDRYRACYAWYRKILQPRGHFNILICLFSPIEFYNLLWYITDDILFKSFESF